MNTLANIKNVFCTLAMGERYANHAAFLMADLEAYGASALVVTDFPKMFETFRNVKIIEHHPENFSFHDKRIALQESLKIGDTAVFIDADTVVDFCADRRKVKQALAYSFPPGLHAWRLYPEGFFDYPHIEAVALSWGLKFNRNVITYSEGLFALSNCKNIQGFFAYWDRFAEEARQRGHNGAGEGTCIGIAAEASGIERHYTTHMMQSRLPDLLWHTSLDFSRRKIYHLKHGITEALKGNLNFHQHCWGR